MGQRQGADRLGAGREMGRTDVRRLDRAQGLRTEEPGRVTAFARVTGDAYAAYRKDAKAFAGNAANVEKIVKLTGAKPQEIAELMAGSTFPTLAEQATLLGSNTVKAVAETSKFLKEQGKVDKLLADYQPYVTPRFVQAAAKGAPQQVAAKN